MVTSGARRTTPQDVAHVIVLVRQTIPRRTQLRAIVRQADFAQESSAIWTNSGCMFLRDFCLRKVLDVDGHYGR